ncbi:MAG: DUF2914 domain-containing protein [Gammaproteobacteria bacterium]
MNKLILTTLSGILLLTAGLAQAQNTPAASSTMPAAASPASTMPAAPAPAAAASASVGNAQFTSAVNNRAPADDISTLDNSHNQVFFYTVLKDAAGQTITHRWEYNGKSMAEVKFEPKANHWRVWSSKTLLPSQTGTWTVEVVDGSGNVLTSKTFDYTQAQAAAASPKATHKVPNTASMTPAPSAGTH